MAKNRQRKPRETAPASAFDQARDEMFQHIMQCGVIGCEPQHQADWFDDTMRYLADRYRELTTAELGQLRLLGERFVQPPKRVSSEVASAI